MSRTARSRSYNSTFPPSGHLFGKLNGIAYDNQNNAYSPTFGRYDCVDSKGRPVVASSMTITKRIPEYGTVNGYYVGPTWVPGYRDATAVNYLPYTMRYSDFGHNPLPSMPTAAGSMADMLARTNPSRPSIVPLDLLQDLVELPKMLKEAGSFLKKGGRGGPLSLRDLANQHLALQFGWKPLIKDIHDLLDTNLYVQQRLGEIERLYSGSGLKRRVRLGNWTSASDSNVNLNSDTLCFITARQQSITKAVRWGTVRWKPTGTFYGYRPEHTEMLKQAKKTALGFTSVGLFQGAWDLLPWTFLVDWGVNVKSVVSQYANTIPATPHDACVMTETTTTYQWSNVGVPLGFNYVPGKFTRISKERYVGSGALSVSIPMLDANRLSILGSLFVQRFLR
ncbi:MAG: putative maturation protein [Leviviridae sp.]|nr:MAG: putative maturation protein [Leviviridae sp.]